jgi:hypothetical protein
MKKTKSISEIAKRSHINECGYIVAKPTPAERRRIGDSSRLYNEILASNRAQITAHNLWLILQDLHIENRPESRYVLDQINSLVKEIN